MPHVLKTPASLVSVAAPALLLGLFLTNSGCCTPRGAGNATASGAQPAVAAKQTATPAPAPAKPNESPKTKETCGSCNGVWAVHGLGETEICNCRTKDAGKVCRDGADCQGSCLADENRFEVVQTGPPPKGFYAGKCSEFETSFGCYKFIPAGIRAKGPQLKEEAADAMCVD